MTAVYLALLRATAAAATAAARTLMGHKQPTPWVDDGLCTCAECRLPWLAGDSAPSSQPLPPELAARQSEVWSG